MSFTEKHFYKIFDVRYERNEQIGSFFMSQFPTNEEIFYFRKNFL